MANSIEATGAQAAQTTTDSELPPSVLCTPVDPFPQPRARADSQSHFSLRPALTALQNTFISRRRASSVSDAASQNSASIRSSHPARFAGLGMEPRPRTNSSATVVPPNVKRYPSALDFSIMESPDEAMSRAPRIPSFLAGTVASAPVPTANAASASSLVIDVAIRPVAEEIVVAAETSVHPHPAAELAHTGPSHAQRESDSYLGGARAVGGALPASPVLTPAASGASSPVALRSPLLSPVRSTVVSPARSTAVSPVRSITVVSPKQSVAMGTAPSSPVYPSTHSLMVPTTIPTSPSYTAAIPFPSAEDNESYASDDASGFVSQYAYSHQSGYDTPALYTGTTNTSPTLSVTRVVSGEVPPTLRLGPGMGFTGVGTYVGGTVQGGVFLGARDSTSSGLLSPGRPRTVDSGVSGFGRAEFDKDG
ncbi:hypothetical protein FS749_005138 [Ceratobasidium sp. UAMH 11750]|nr:hypothetical protein FS749_005138 [Ceratobasidium sp. UAMH 11750]